MCSGAKKKKKGTPTKTALSSLPSFEKKTGVSDNQSESYYDNTYNDPVDMGDQYENLAAMQTVSSQSNKKVIFEDIPNDSKISFQDLPEGSSSKTITTSRELTNPASKTTQQVGLLEKNRTNSRALDRTVKSVVIKQKNTAREMDPTARSEISDNVSDSLATTLSIDNTALDPGLNLEPNELKFSLEGGMDKVQLENKTDKRLALKIKTTNNAKYRVDPIYSFVDAHDSKDFEVLCVEGGEHSTDKLIFIYSEADAEELDAFSHFQKQGIIQSRQAIPLIA